MKIARIPIALILLSLCASAQDGQQQFVVLGDFKLESGEIIQQCRIGFRTYGKLNADKSNVILTTTWFGGTTEQLAGSIGPGRLMDTSKYYVIAMDALGNGISSSPSNSKLQPRLKFPQFTVRDMVNSQHELLTRVLHFNHIKAVMGTSMGGMQTFQWMVSYPDFMDKAVPILGTPRMAPYDVIHWQMEIDIIMHDSGWNNGEYTENPARVVLGEIGAMLLSTPGGYNRQNNRQQVLDAIEKYQTEPRMDANNHIRTAQAVLKLDVSDVFGGSMEKAAAAVKAKVLVISATQDQAVTPGEALAFAKLLNADVVELTGDCGHGATGCEADKVNAAVASFLEK
jgi:homoserine O-acetyltransferase/O-succinyltransferase